MAKIVSIILLLFAAVSIMVSCNQKQPTPTQPIQTEIPPIPYITQEQAIDIAKKNVPESLAETATINAKWTPVLAPHGNWQISFDNFMISKEKLGWVASPDGTPPVDLVDYTADLKGYFFTILINIDGQTGEVTFKMASNMPNLGPPPTVSVTFPGIIL